jgi:hypothetical protein
VVQQQQGGEHRTSHLANTKKVYYHKHHKQSRLCALDES